MDREQMAWVYFAQCPDGDIKIGTITKYAFIQRMGALWLKHGSIRVLGVVEGGHKKEAEIHKCFHEHRRKSRRTSNRGVKYTEYFAPAPELLAFIKENSVDLSQLNSKRMYKRKHDYYEIGF